MCLVRPRMVEGLLLVPFWGCYGSGHGHLDVDEADGERLSPEDLRLTDDLEYPHYPKIIHNGSEYAVVWYNNNASGVFLDRLDEDGNLKGESFMITDTLIFSNRFQIVPAEDYYAAVWEYGDNLAFGRFGCLDRPDP